MNLANWIRERAHQLGFDLVGFAPVGAPATFEAYRTWVQRGHHGEMAYLARPASAAKRADPGLVLPGTSILVAVAKNYHTTPLPASHRADPSRGVIASYAWGADYHEVLTPRLERLGAELERAAGSQVESRAYVDTGPILERELAAQAGLGFIGKNTNLISRRFGSWLFLGELFISAGRCLEPPGSSAPARHAPVAGAKGTTELVPETSLSPLEQQGTCGKCTRCLDACPTGAFVAPYVLDARRCISYLTIELRGPIPRDLRPLLGNRVFGCDVCQDVCPWNRRFSRPSSEPDFQPRDGGPTAPNLLELMALDDAEFRRRYRNSPLWRTKRRGLLRNVAVALGNWGSSAAVPALVAGLHDPEPLVRGHAAWALGRIPTTRATESLRHALRAETDEWARQEIGLALEGF